MLELALVVCLSATPNTCKDVSLTYSAESVTPMQCLIGASPEIAKWVEAHPKWIVRRWSCRPAGQLAKT